MNKETLIEKLLNEKAEKNNTIDLNAYALGLDAMYEALVLYGVIQQREQLLAFCDHLNTYAGMEEIRFDFMMQDFIDKSQ